MSDAISSNDIMKTKMGLGELGGLGDDGNLGFDTSQPGSSFQHKIKNEGRLVVTDCRVSPRLTVLHNYINIRAYAGEGSSRYTHLVVEHHLNLEDSFIVSKELLGALHSHHLKSLLIPQLLLLETKKMMGDREFWWRAIAQRAKPIDAEDGLEDTNEKSGSDEGQKMKQQIQPTEDDTQGVLDLEVVVADPVTKQMKKEDLPGSSLPRQQTKSQRKKDRRRERRANATVDKPSTTADEPSESNKLTPKYPTHELANMTTDDIGNATALKRNQKDGQTTEVDEFVPINLPQSDRISSSRAILHAGNGKFNENTDAVSNMNTAQSRQVSDVTLDEGEGKAMARNQKDTKTDDFVDAARKASVHNDQFPDVTIDKGERTVPTKTLIGPKTGEKVKIGIQGATQNKKPFSVTPARQKGKIPISSKPEKETDRNIDVASPIISQRIQPLDITLQKETDRKLLKDPSDGKIDQSTGRASNSTTQAVEPGAITHDQEDTASKNPSGKKSGQNITLSSSFTDMSHKKIDQKINISSNVPTQSGKPSITTLDKGKGRTLMEDLPATKIPGKSDTASKTQSETRDISRIPSKTQEEKRTVTGLTPHNDPRANFARLVAIPNLQLLNKSFGKGKEKAAIKDVSDNKIDESIYTGSQSRNEPVHVAETSNKYSKGKVMVAGRIDEDDPSSSVAGKITAPNKQTVQISLNEGTSKEFTGNPFSESISHSVSAASKSSNQMVDITEISSKMQKEQASIIDVTDKSDPSPTVASMTTAQNEQPSDIMLGKESKKKWAGSLRNTNIYPSAGASRKPKTKTVHFHPNLTVVYEEEEHLGDKIVTKPIEGTSKQETHSGHGSGVSTDINQREAQATNFSNIKSNQPLSHSSSLSIQHQPKPFPAGAMAGVRGPRGLKWAYFTHTKADEALLVNGIWLFEKPKTYFKYQPYHYVRRGLGLDLAPIAVATYEEDDVHEPHEPNIDVDNTAVWINTHIVPWHDVRSKTTHPDFLPTPKLTEYQACESLGLAVWRHDRGLLKCRLAECKVKTADHNPLTVICLGCGPKTIIRYCSVAHQIADLEGHWEECGDPDYLMRRVIDHTTTPARFGRLWPAIRDRSGNSSYERSRQATYAAMHHGRYTLFDPVTQEPTALIWPTNDGQAAVMESRVERLLNYALFDHKHGRITGLLYRMIRQCLIQKNFWAIGPQFALKTQFKAEFGCDVSKVSEQPLCECEWMGGRLPRGRHVAGCKQLYLAYSAQYQVTGIKGFLEMVEGRYWALRAWQQRHPTVGDWTARVAGVGFGAEEVEGTEPFLGPGWNGWGAPPDDLVD